MASVRICSNWLPAIAWVAIGVGFKVGGDVRGGYGWCDFTFALFLAAAGVSAWQAFRPLATTPR
jgi:hypothetical protein